MAEKPKTLNILWKAIEPRHCSRAQERKKVGPDAYAQYILSLVERLNEQPLPARPSEAQKAEIIKAFEKAFGNDRI